MGRLNLSCERAQYREQITSHLKRLMCLSVKLPPSSRHFWTVQKTVALLTIALPVCVCVCGVRKTVSPLSQHAESVFKTLYGTRDGSMFWYEENERT